jgi:hypothetical protein
MKIAIVTTDLLIGQKSFYMIKELEKRVKDTDYCPCILFTNMSAPVMDIPFATMNIHNITHFNGVCIATDLESADIVRKSNNRMDRYLYIWDLEWLRRTMKFEQVVEILRDPKLKLIARSESHKEVIENYCNREVCGIVEDFNLEQIEEVCHA